MDDSEVDGVVSDCDMPGIDGLEFLAAVRAKNSEKSFMSFTGHRDESLASETISVGVTDYTQKGHGEEQYAVLTQRVRNAVKQARATAAATSA